MEEKMTVRSFINERFGTLSTVNQNGELWFSAADVCASLDIANYRDATRRLNSNAKDVVITDTLGGKQKMIVINERGLYKLVFTSRKPEAEAFQDWVFGEVLPTLRKHGAYIDPSVVNQMDMDQFVEVEARKNTSPVDTAVASAIEESIMSDAEQGYSTVVTPGGTTPEGLVEQFQEVIDAVNNPKLVFLSMARFRFGIPVKQKRVSNPEYGQMLKVYYQRLYHQFGMALFTRRKESGWKPAVDCIKAEEWPAVLLDAFRFHMNGGVDMQKYLDEMRTAFHIIPQNQEVTECETQTE